MPDWVMMIAGQAFTAGAIYGGIKGAIALAINKAEAANSCAIEAKGIGSKAHDRIDTLLSRNN